MAPPFVEDSHLTILPVYPLSVNVPPFEPVQAVVTLGERVPPAGDGRTVTVTVAELLHPFASVPVTVYVVLVVGLATTELPTVDERPVAGLQV